METVGSRVQEQGSDIKRVILIIDGVDQFLDDQYQKEEIPDWLPGEFPPNVKMIVTANVNSRSYKYLQTKKCPTIHIQELSEQARANIINNYLNSPAIIFQSPVS